jgi:hypothetical protein
VRKFQVRTKRRLSSAPDVMRQPRQLPRRRLARVDGEDRPVVHLLLRIHSSRDDAHLLRTLCTRFREPC